MTVEIQQEWRNLKVTIVNPYDKPTRFFMNFFVEGINRVTGNSDYIPIGGTFVSIYDINLLRRVQSRPNPDAFLTGQTIQIQSMDMDVRTNIELSNSIVYKENVIPVEVIVATVGISAVAIGAIGYYLHKRKHR